MLSRFEQFSFVISGIYRYIQKLERDEMIKYGYKGSFAQYLVAMNRYPNGITAKQLCDICDKDKAAVSRAITEMEEKGLVVRKKEKFTSYRAPLLLTEEGKRATEFVSKRAKAAVESVGNELSDADRKILYSALDFISSKLQTLTKIGIPENNE